MKLLFVQGGSRVKVSSKGEHYVDGNFTNSVFEDYFKLADEVTFLLRKDSKRYSDEELDDRFNKLDAKYNLYLLPDFYKNIKSRFNIKALQASKNEVEELVKSHDRIIIRSIGNFYTNTVYKFCKKYNKKFLVEVTGFAFDGLWYHSWKGKMVAFQREYYLKKALKNTPYAVYVTQEALQKRYPCNGTTIGCSDVRLTQGDERVLNKRATRILNNKDKFIIGTAAFLDVKWKGQEYVIKAIAKLKKLGFNKFEYQLVGAGDGQRLKKLVKQLNLDDCVRFMGALPHDKVFEWMDNIDLYIQPSFQEGLCRVIVEAMSRACPIICTDVGGNFELIQNDYLYKPKDIRALSALIKEKCTNAEELLLMAETNFCKSKKYNENLLRLKRDSFYTNFMN